MKKIHPFIPQKLYLLINKIKKSTIAIDKLLNNIHDELPARNRSIYYRRFYAMEARNWQYLIALFIFENHFKDVHYDYKKTKSPILDKQKYKYYYSLMKGSVYTSDKLYTNNINILINALFQYQKDTTKLIIFLHNYVWDAYKKKNPTDEDKSARNKAERLIYVTLSYQKIMYSFLRYYFLNYNHYKPPFKKTPLPKHKKS